MKKTFAVIFALFMLACLAACSNGDGTKAEATAESTALATAEAASETLAPTSEPIIPEGAQKITAEELFEKCKIQGRTTIQKKGISLDFTASSIEFNCYCEGDITADIAATVTQVGGAARMYINVYVDGVLVTETRKSQRVLNNAKTLKIATGLEKGMHNIIIERENEAERGTFYIKDINIKGVLLEKPVDNKYFIEFIGDSITTAYGNLYPNEAGTESSLTKEPSYDEYQDGSQSYACLTAKLLGADYSIVAQQGLGCNKGYYPHTMNETWKYTCYQNSRKTEWSFERKADVVVIAMGTNDFSFIKSGATDEASVINSFKELISNVRSVYQDAKIVWIYGMMRNDANDAIKTVIAEMGGADKSLYAFELTMDNNGGNGHPSIIAHKAASVKLADYIRTLL